MLNRFALLLLSTTVLIPAAALAQAPPAAIDTAIGAQRDVELDLYGATVEVVIDEAATPWLRARHAAGTAADRPLDLEVSWQTGPTTIRRPPEEGDETPHHLTIELTVKPSQRLRIEGADLVVSVASAAAREERAAGEDPAPDGEDDEDGAVERPATAGPAPVERPRPRQRTPGPSPDEKPEFQIELGVVDSRVDLLDVGDALLVLTGGSLRVERAHGRLVLAPSGGCEAEVLDHRGALEIEAADSELAVIGGQSDVRIRLDRTQAIFRDGRGALRGTAAGGLLVVDNRQGETVLEGRDGTFEIRGNEAHGTLELSGDNLTVAIESWHGRLRVTQRLGSLRARDWFGIAEVTLEGTEAELGALAGPLTLKMKADARARVEGIRGRLQAEVVRARLEVRDADGLAVTASGAEVVAAGIHRIDSFEASRSTVELDLTETPGQVQLALKGQSRTAVSIQAPCYVVIQGPAAAANLGSGVRVSGCEVMMGRQRRAGRHGAAGSPPRFLYTKLDADAELTVDGVP